MLVGPVNTDRTMAMRQIDGQLTTSMENRLAADTQLHSVYFHLLSEKVPHGLPLGLGCFPSGVGPFSKRLATAAAVHGAFGGSGPLQRNGPLGPGFPSWCLQKY